MTDTGDRLIELLDDTLQDWECDVSNKTLTEIAEHLSDNGVIVQEWISVKDRLPEKPGKYLVYGSCFGNKAPQIWICECISIGSLMGWCNSAKNPVVTHWMPLPPEPEDAERVLKGREVNG